MTKIALKLTTGGFRLLRGEDITLYGV